MHKRLKIVPVPALRDNYIWLAYFLDSPECFVVDPGHAKPVLEYINQHQLVLTSILSTHHHPDHTAGITELVEKFPSTSVFAPAYESIAHQTHALYEGDICAPFKNSYRLKVYQTPGHTKGHIVYYSDFFIDQFILFCGDTLFSGGCGRLFEGTYSQLYHSLMRLRQLPSRTQIYCGHEYTINNLTFSHWLEPSNIEILQTLQDLKLKRSQGQASLPSYIGQEKIINPFFKCDDANFMKMIQLRFSLQAQSPVKVFASIRKLKDQWGNDEFFL